MNISIKRIAFTCFVLFLLSIPQVSALEIISFDGYIQTNGDLDVTIQYELSTFEKSIVKTPLKSESQLISNTLEELGNDNEIIYLDSGNVRVLISDFADVNQNGEYDTQPFWTDETIRDISLSFPDGWTYEKYHDNRVPQLIHKPDTTTALTFDSSGNEVTVYLKSPYITDEQKKELIELLLKISISSEKATKHESQLFHEIDKKCGIESMGLRTEYATDMLFLSLDIKSATESLTAFKGKSAKDVLLTFDAGSLADDTHLAINPKLNDFWGFGDVSKIDALWYTMKTSLDDGSIYSHTYDAGMKNIAIGYMKDEGATIISKEFMDLMAIEQIKDGGYYEYTPLNQIYNNQNKNNRDLVQDLMFLIYSSDITEKQYNEIKTMLEMRYGEIEGVNKIPLIANDFVFLPTNEYNILFDITKQNIDTFKNVQTGIGLLQTSIGILSGGSTVAAGRVAEGLVGLGGDVTANEIMVFTYDQIRTVALRSSTNRIYKTGEITRMMHHSVSSIIANQQSVIDPVDVDPYMYGDIYSKINTDYYVHIFFDEQESKILFDNNQEITVKASYIFKKDDEFVIASETKKLNEMPNSGQLDIQIKEIFYGDPGNYDVNCAIEISTGNYNAIYSFPVDSVYVKDFPVKVDFDFKYLPRETGNILSQGAVLTFKNTGSNQIVIDSVDEINGFAIYDSGTKHGINLQSDGFKLGPHEEYNVYLNFPTFIFTPFPDGIKDYEVEAVYNVNGIGFTTTHASQ